MKQFFLKSAVLLTFCTSMNVMHSQAKKNNFDISGKVSNADAGAYLYLEYVREDGVKVRDSIAIINNTAKYSGYTEFPIKVDLYNNPAMENYGTSWNEIYIGPGTQKFVVDFKNLADIQYEGSATQRENEELKALLSSVRPSQDSLRKTFGPLMQKRRTEKNRDTLAVLEQKYTAWNRRNEQVQNKGLQLKLSFLEKHPNSYLAPDILRGELTQAVALRNTAAIIATYNKLGSQAKAGRNGKEVQQMIANLEGSAVGKPAPAFKIFDINGKPITAADFKDKKYILLDFWSSYNAPSHLEFPKLRWWHTTYFDKGLEIISISEDKNEQAWRKAVAKWGLSKLNPSRISETIANDIKEKYMVNALPTKILIDKKGKIVGRWTGGGAENEAEMDKMLTEIFQNEK